MLEIRCWIGALMIENFVSEELCWWSAMWGLTIEDWKLRLGHWGLWIEEGELRIEDWSCRIPHAAPCGGGGSLRACRQAELTTRRVGGTSGEVSRICCLVVGSFLEILGSFSEPKGDIFNVFFWLIFRSLFYGVLEDFGTLFERLLDIVLWYFWKRFAGGICDLRGPHHILWDGYT